jgi:lipoyl(octanoyl) transferase
MVVRVAGFRALCFACMVLSCAAFKGVRLRFRVQSRLRSVQQKLVDVHNLVPFRGLISYTEGLAMQKSMFERVVGQQAGDLSQNNSSMKVGEVLLLQHSPVYTLGSGTKATSGPFSRIGADGQQLDYETVAVDRAGDATYHGPGQVVMYPVLDLVRSTIAGKKKCAVTR